MKKLQLLRIKERLTITQLGEKTGISPSYLSQLERGKKNNPSLPVLNTLAKEFKVPVTVDKNLSKTIDLDKQDFESDTVKVNSMKITPFEMIVDLNYKEGNWTDYRTVIYDENGEILQFSQSTADENNNTEKLYFESPNSESTSIRVVVEKPILGEKERWENKNRNGATYEEIGKETVFDKVIQIK